MESKKDVNQFKEQLEETDSIPIATGIEAHEFLKELKITHKVIDDYLESSDYKTIDSMSIHFALNWYKKEGIDLSYGELNLGFLIESDIKHYFLHMLRNFFGIRKINSRLRPTKIFVGSLTSIAQILEEKENNIEIQGNLKKEIKIEGEELEVPIPFSKSRSFKISRKSYLKMKKFVENFFTQHPNNHSTESILLLDFNPVYFSYMLDEFSKNFDDVFLLNQRRPAVWNVESLKIVSKHKCKMLNLENFNDNITQKKIIMEQEDFLKKILALRNNKKVTGFFTVDGFDLWKIIQEELIPILVERGKEMIFRYTLIKKIFEKRNFSVVLEWAYTAFEERILNTEAKRKDIPIVFLQHSIIVEDPKYDIFLPFQPTLPGKGDIVAVYGQTIANFIRNKKIPENQIITSGSPRHDPFFNARKNARNDQSVLIATSSSYPRYKADGSDIRAYDNLQKTIQKLLLEIKKHPIKKPIIKLHPRKDYFELASFIRKIDKKVPIYKDQKSIEFLKDCDAVISTNFSTILLEGMILGKPTMWISTQREHLQEEGIIKKKATLFVTNYNEIENCINKLLNDNTFRKDLIDNANKYINEYFSNHGVSSRYLARKLRELQ